MTRFWLGGYGPGMDGTAEGIGLLAGDEGRETALSYRGPVTQTASPSWLARHPSLDVVYAALEGDAAVQAFRRAGESSLAPLGEPLPAGDSVCHLAVAPDGSSLIASCYGDGRVVRFGIATDGRLMQGRADAAAQLRAALFGDRDEDASGADLVPAGIGAPAADPYGDARDGALSHAGGAAGGAVLGAAGRDLVGAAPGIEDSGFVDRAALAGSVPATEQPEAPRRSSHAHAAAFLPDGRIATTDLGFDLVRIWRVPAGAATQALVLDHEVVLPKGTGPRHMVVHPSGHLHVVTEYSCEVFTLTAGPDGTWRIASATMTSPIAAVGTDFPAELARTRDGQFLYTALRGSNTIAALRVLGSGERLESVALADSGVDWPRHHLVHEGKLLVAGQRSDSISLIDLDERTGAPLGIRHRAPAPTPTHFLPVR